MTKYCFKISRAKVKKEKIGRHHKTRVIIGVIQLNIGLNFFLPLTKTSVFITLSRKSFNRYSMYNTIKLSYYCYIRVCAQNVSQLSAPCFSFHAPMNITIIHFICTNGFAEFLTFKLLHPLGCFVEVALSGRDQLRHKPV